MASKPIRCCTALVGATKKFCASVYLRLAPPVTLKSVPSAFTPSALPTVGIATPYDPKTVRSAAEETRLLPEGTSNPIVRQHVPARSSKNGTSLTLTGPWRK